MTRARDAADQINILNSSAADATAITIDANENVGVGVSNPSSYQGSAHNLVVGNLTDAGTGMTIVSGTASLGSIHFADGATGDDSYRGFIQYGHATNYMRFATNATERMRIDSSGNVGIGTSSPATPLDVTKAGGGNFVATFQNTTSATPYGVHIKDAASGANGYPLLQVTNSAGSSPYLLVHSGTGNVGIGGVPNTLLHVRDDDNFSGGSRIVAAFSPSLANTQDAGIAFGTFSPDDYWKQGIFWERTGNYGVGNLHFANRGTADATTVSKADAVMTLDSSGNVDFKTGGMNLKLPYNSTTNNSANLSWGMLQLGNNGANRIIAGNTQTGGDFEFIVNNTADLSSSNSSSHNGTVAMAINSSGDVSIGSTANAGYKLSLVGTGTIQHINRTGSDGTAILFQNDGSNVGTISVSGSSTAYNTSSDYRLKTDAQPMTGASARVQALNPVNFEWLSDGSRVDGFLAHEAQAIVPESVSGAKDAMRDEEYEVTPAVSEDVVIPAVLDDEGNELEAERTEQRLVTEAVMGTRSVPDYQGIDQSKLVPLLTAALQEALTEITDLKARVVALEAM